MCRQDQVMRAITPIVGKIVLVLLPCLNLPAVSHFLRLRRNLPCRQSKRTSLPLQMMVLLARSSSVFAARRCSQSHRTTMQKSASIVRLPYLLHCHRVDVEARTARNQRATESVCVRKVHDQAARVIQLLPLSCQAKTRQKKLVRRMTRSI